MPFLTWIPSYVWFFAKLLVLIAVFIWVRGTLPRLRMDQLMNFAWKFMLPMALLNLVTAGVWRFLAAGRDCDGLFAALLVVVPYVLLGRWLAQGWRLEKRVYRFAE